MDEGYLRYSRSPKPIHDIYQKEYWAYYPRMRIGKFDREDIEHFAKLLKVKPSRYGKEWRIEIAGDRVMAVLKQIKPYIRGEKLSQVEMILDNGKFYIPNTTTEQFPYVLSLVKPERLRHYLTKKVTITPAPPRTASPTPMEMQQMRALRAQGLSLREIARIVGYTAPTVGKYLKM